MSHTPGPWWLSQAEDGYAVGQGDRELLRVKNRDDAYLIAAAHKMLNALLVIALDRNISEYLRGHDPKALEQVEAAVAATLPRA
jgi:hypothetical protein